MEQILRLAREANSPFRLESEVKSYCRRMPAVFDKACNSEVWDEDGRRYIDFLSSCGALNYGHNNPHIKSRLLEYLAHDGITTALDLHTVAKRHLLHEFQETILKPRNLTYKIQFPGPTGTNAIEAAIKLARKVTGRQTVVAFSNGFHGMTLGALALTGSHLARDGAGVPLPHVHRLPYDGFRGASADDLVRYEHLVTDPSGGCELPAAFVVETIQGEGGLNVASNTWLATLAKVAAGLGALLIVDDVQAGCGRTGSFFSFERACIDPHIVCLSKSIGGFGLPMSLVLLKPELDVWSPGEHNGTFRGNNLAFVTSTAALEYWRSPEFSNEIAGKIATVTDWLSRLVQDFPNQIAACGLGMMQGIMFCENDNAKRVARRAYLNGLLIETCGSDSEVVKIMPPLTIEPHTLQEGLAKLRNAVEAELAIRQPAVAA